MGFYGNITSTNKTQFAFDKIYPNRFVMDESVEKDGIHIGRFVLVDYEDGLDTLYFPIYKKDNSGIFYADPSFQIVMTTELCSKDTIFKYQAANEIKLYQATGAQGTSNGIKYAKFIEVNNKYTSNYNNDISRYGAGRGFDGTVWQKVYAENNFKYVMIAELNSVVPSFKITADAPTMFPLQPHFDKQSNNVAYWLHWQPQWGFRVKGSKADSIGSDGIELPSDEKTTWVKPILDANQQITSIVSGDIDGAIYYNKDGFNPKKRSYYEGNLKDSIRITPTGKSGNLYNDHSGNPDSVKEDIQEISIILPSIGNAISTIWDLTYGNERNLDVNWGSTKGIRMVKELENGNGFTYDKEHISTIAGVINSVHDLMGQLVITDSTPENNLDYSDEAIYYKDGKYYRKFYEYDYERVEDLSNIGDDKFKLIGKLINYEPNKYYTKEEKENYHLSKSNNFYNSRNYYTVKENKQELSFNYEKGSLYYKNNNDYYQELSEEPREGIKYFTIERTLGNYRFYKKDTYYYKVNESTYALATDSELNSNYNYYIIKGGEPKEELIQDPITGQWELKEIIKGGTPEEVILTPFRKNYYYKLDNNNYILFMEEEISIEDKQTLYTLEIREIAPAYVSGKYYYKDNNGNFIKDSSNSIGDPSKEYYLIEVEKVNKFYIPNKYYYKDNGIYKLSEGALNTNLNYYERELLYVINDEKGIFPKGMIWNEGIVNVHDGLSIGFRTEKITIKELEGFARTFNTIHGLILETRKILEGSYEDTRDKTTVQGVINTLNDIIAKFNEITPNKLVITDEYGRYNPAEYKDNTWLDWNVNPNSENPTVELIHKNADTNIKTTVSQNSQEPKFGKTFNIPVITFDEKGHYNGNRTETVKVPLPSLESNKVSGVLTAMALDAENGKITNTFTNLTDVKLDGYSKTNDKGALATTDSLEIGLSKIENNISNTNTNLENAKTELIELINDNETDIENKVSNLTALVNNNETDIEKKLSDLTIVVNNNENDIENKVIQTNTKIDNAASEIRKEFADADAAINGEIENLKKEDASIKNTISIMNTVLTEKDKNFESSIDALNTNLTTTASSIRDELNNAKEDLNTTIRNLENTLNTTKETLEEADSELSIRIGVNENKLDGINTTVVEHVSSKLNIANSSLKNELEGKINELAEGAVSENALAISQEAKDREAADNQLTTSINSINETVEKINGQVSGITHPTVQESINAAIGEINNKAAKIVREEEEPKDKNNTIWISPTSREIRIFDGEEWRVLLTSPMTQTNE